MQQFALLQLYERFADVGGKPQVGFSVAPDAVSTVVVGEVGEAVFGFMDAGVVWRCRTNQSPQFAGGLFAAAERVVRQLFLVTVGVVGDAAVEREAGVGKVGKFEGFARS